MTVTRIDTTRSNGLEPRGRAEIAARGARVLLREAARDVDSAETRRSSHYAITAIVAVDDLIDSLEVRTDG